MEKNKIFSKFNIKNYNNELEKILETKLFSSDVKNMLLSMLYKIENAYNDYTVVKREVLSQRDFFEYLLQVIRDECNSIEFLKPEGTELPQVDEKKGSIICYPNEKSLLSCILYLGGNNVTIPTTYKYVQEAMQKMNLIGNNISQTEIIRDFNGWSWDIVVNEIEDINYNIIYQSLLLLAGKRISEINAGEKGQILNLKNKNCSNEFLKLLYQLSLEQLLLKDKNKVKEIKKLKEEKNKQLSMFLNKKEFVQKVTNEKRKSTAEIDKIDKILNDVELIKKEYKERNSKLPNKEKIFSISYLVDMLEKDRIKYLDRIKKCNIILDPKQFVKERDMVKEEAEFLNEIDPNMINEKILKYVTEFLECACKQINKIEEKDDMIDWIYKIRYYGHIPLNSELYLKDCEKLNIQFEKTIKTLIKKAQKLKVWDAFTDDYETSYIILKELFNSKMINLENVNIQCNYNKRILTVEYYDGNVLEMKSEFNVESIRIKKKIKLFLK